MTQRKFVIGDPHWGNQLVCDIVRESGAKLRPWTNAKDMDIDMVKAWNATVRPVDKVYVVGDVALRKSHLQTMAQCNGDKILIKGNHDQERLMDYYPLFRDIRACFQISKCLLTHIPIHPDCMRRWRANIHGHLHDQRVMLDDQPDPRYVCVSVEQINYRPILLEEVLQRLPVVE